MSYELRAGAPATHNPHPATKSLKLGGVEARKLGGQRLDPFLSFYAMRYAPCSMPCAHPPHPSPRIPHRASRTAQPDSGVNQIDIWLHIWFAKFPFCDFPAAAELSPI